MEVSAKLLLRTVSLCTSQTENRYPAARKCLSASPPSWRALLRTMAINLIFMSNNSWNTLIESLSVLLISRKESLTVANSHHGVTGAMR